jgi:tRNA (guanine-N7-)-methyltransferase
MVRGVGRGEKVMRRSVRLPVEELAPYLFEVDAGPRSAREPVIASQFSSQTVTHDPLSPEYGGEGISTHQPVRDISSQRPALIDWHNLFGNANPVEIEVGFGKGLFLVNCAQARPETNFFGIEIERKYTLFTATRLAKRALRNAKVVAFDARGFLEGYVAADSVAAMHVYFPDPWWKNRHRKRRLFTEAFASACARVLISGGYLHFVSDVEDYFAESARMLARLNWMTELPAPAVRAPNHEMDFLTNFERKYRREGRPIYRGVWQKR